MCSTTPKPSLPSLGVTIILHLAFITPTYFYTYYCIHKCSFKQSTALFLNCKKQRCMYPSVFFSLTVHPGICWHYLIVLVHLFFSLLYNKHCMAAQRFIYPVLQTEDCWQVSTNNAAIYTGTRLLLNYVWTAFRAYTQEWIWGSWGVFNFTRCSQIILQSDCIILYSFISGPEF